MKKVELSKIEDLQYLVIKMLDLMKKSKLLIPFYLDGSLKLSARFSTELIKYEKLVEYSSMIFSSNLNFLEKLKDSKILSHEDFLKLQNEIIGMSKSIVIGTKQSYLMSSDAFNDKRLGDEKLNEALIELNKGIVEVSNEIKTMETKYDFSKKDFEIDKVLNAPYTPNAKLTEKNQRNIG